MLIDSRSVRNVSRTVAIFTGILVIICAMLWRLNIAIGILFLIIMMVVMYRVLRWLLRRLIQNKFRSIYEIMESRELLTGGALNSAEYHSNNVGEDLRHWAEQNVDEISRLKANERYRKEFFGDVSHEIKTPLFALQGYVLTLLDGAIYDQNINRKYLERSEKSIERLINIVNDLEAISKLESGELVLANDTFDITELCLELTESFYIEAQKATITLKTDKLDRSESLYVSADRRRIGQVLSNLIMNAIRYGRSDGFVEVSVEDLEDKVLVEVSDNGVGIKPEDQTRIFERFYRVDRSRSRASGGTGLGLSIVKHIIEAHQERISVRSRLGDGTVFSFTLGKESNYK